MKLKNMKVLVELCLQELKEKFKRLSIRMIAVMVYTNLDSKTKFAYELTKMCAKMDQKNLTFEQKDNRKNIWSDIMELSQKNHFKECYRGVEGSCTSDKVLQIANLGWIFSMCRR